MPEGTAFSEAVTSGAYWSKVAAHAAAGGTLNALNDGDFGHAFIAAGVTEAANPAIDTIADGAPEGRTLRILASAMVGGTVSHLVGGNFGNGAITGAFQRAFNAEGNHCGEQCLEEQTYRDNMQTRLRLGLSGTKDGAEVAGVVVEEGYWAAITGVLGRLTGGARMAEVSRLGHVGETAVRAQYAIGEKAWIRVGLRFRRPDGINAALGTLNEVKNVGRQNWTRQLIDYADYASEHKLQFNLYLRSGATISTGLREAWRSGRVNVIEVPMR